MAFKNSKEIKEVFVRDGWPEDIEFEEFIYCGKKYFKMKRSGNVYNGNGDLVYFSLKGRLKMVWDVASSDFL